MQSNALGIQEGSARQDESPADRRAARRRAVESLDARTARAVQTLFAIEQTHLTEFHNE